MSEDPVGGAGARVIREIIRTPVFAEIIKSHISSVDPESARVMARTLLWEDPNLSLSLAGTSPAAINYAVEFLLEIGRQLSQLPDPLLDEFIARVTAEVDVEKIAELPAVYGRIVERVVAANLDPAAVGGAITASARLVNKSAASNRYFLRDVLENVDWFEVLKAVLSVAGSLVFSIVSIVSRRIRSALEK